MLITCGCYIRSVVSCKIILYINREKTITVRVGGQVNNFFFVTIEDPFWIEKSYVGNLITLLRRRDFLL